MSDGIPTPNPTGFPTKTNIDFIRFYVEKPALDAEPFDKVRLIQWIRQLLKYIDLMEKNNGR